MDFVRNIVLVASIVTFFCLQNVAFGQSSKPNIILINLDDADVDLLDDWALEAYFPAIRTNLSDQGTRFSNFHSIAPLCGPSRAALFRGQYPHNTGVEFNALGWEIFYDNGFTDSEIGHWMQDAGYHTALVGKYCHEEFPQASKNKDYWPPGWTDFRSSIGGLYFGTFRSSNGSRLRNGPEAYRTDICLLYTSPSPRDRTRSRMPSSA